MVLKKVLDEDYWNKVSIQKKSYQELDKFKPGDGGLKYYPLPAKLKKENKK